MPRSNTILEAPYPKIKVTSVLPKPRFQDGRATESTVQIKRAADGRTLTYTNPSDRIKLTLPFRLTRKKSLEVEAFIKSYQSAHWRITLYDDSMWDAQLVGVPVSRQVVDRQGTDSRAGKEFIDVTLTFSAIRLS